MRRRSLLHGRFTTIQALALAATLIRPPCGEAALDVEDSHLPRVRSRSPSIAAIIREGSARSMTFRRLVERVDATDGLVFVDQGRCGHGVRACLLLAMVVAGPHRVLQILIDDRKADEALMVSIGHELQHAVEVLDEPGIKNGPDMYFFFRRYAPQGSDRFETPAAIGAGFDIRAELDASRRSGLAKDRRLDKWALKRKATLRGRPHG